jgi:hypothetical protein
MDSLFEQIKDAVLTGHIVSFRIEINQLLLSVEKTEDEVKYKQEQCLPLNDHFYEERVSHCLNWCVNNLNLNTKP